MKPAPFTYHAPGTLEAALELLASHENARALAGGQSLMPMLNFRLASPEHVVDLNRIPALSGIREDGGFVVMGAMTRQREIERSALVAERLPLLAEAIRHVGHRQTRSRGTLGGSLAHADPAAELPAIALAYDAEVRLKNRCGERALPIAQFLKGPLTTAAAPDELVTEVRLRPWPQGHRHAFVEFARRHGDFAIASAAALVARDRTVLVLGGVAAVPVALHFAAPDPAEIERHIGQIEMLDDPAYPAWYRRKLAATLARRALEAATRR